MKIEQGARSTALYWAEFQNIIADLDYNDSTYIDKFDAGLPERTQTQLAMLPTKPTTMTAVTLGFAGNRSVGRIKGNQATFDNSQRNNLRSCVWVRW